jgi:hypothetical protein
MDNQTSTEVRITPKGDHRWYWEVVDDRDHVESRGVASTVQEACEQARSAARKRSIQ